MEIVFFGLMIIAVILMFVGFVWFLVEAFRESVWWGLGCFFISPVSLVFLVLHWDVAKKPFGLQILGFALYFVGMVLAETNALSSI